MVRINIPSDYACPLCPGHEDTEFYESALIGRPICEGCSEDLFHYCAFDETPDAPLIAKVEKLTGKPWAECRVIQLQENIERSRPCPSYTPEEQARAERAAAWYSELLAAAKAELKKSG